MSRMTCLLQRMHPRRSRRGREVTHSKGELLIARYDTFSSCSQRCMRDAHIVTPRATLCLYGDFYGSLPGSGSVSWIV